MSPLVSFLIPSRGRFDRLLKAIESLHATAANKDAFDVRVKFDDDDEESLKRKPELDRFGNVHVLVGPRLNSYGSVYQFLTDLAASTPAQWVWIFSDDTTLIGKGWDAQLEGVPTTGVIVQPEIHKLHTSIYRHDNGGPCPCVPNGCWKTWTDVLPDPSDTELAKLMRNEGGWKTHYLNGITVWHERDHEDVLEVHRKL